MCPSSNYLQTSEVRVEVGRTMADTHDNWERLVAATLRWEELWQLFHDNSRTHSISSVSSDFSWTSPLPDVYAGGSSRYLQNPQSSTNPDSGQKGSYFDPSNKPDWEIDRVELDFATASIIGKGVFGEVVKAIWRGTPVAVKRIRQSNLDDSLVQNFRLAVTLLMKLRHPNIVQSLGAATEKKPLMLITEHMSGGDLHQFLKEKGALSPLNAINFALDIARGVVYLHYEPNVIIHGDLNPRNILLVNSSADHLKVGDVGLKKLVRVQNSHDADRYMAPQAFKGQKYEKQANVFSFAMILYEMLEGDPPLSNYEQYEAARYVAEGHRPIFRVKSSIPELRE